MTEATCEAEFEHRLPAAYSQGFAHVRVVTLINADDVGPLAVPDKAPVFEDREAAYPVADAKEPV
jgi:hypothetical protein